MKKLISIILIIGILLITLQALAATRLNLFHIAKSENRNQVHYAVTLDDKCLPLGKSPIYAYWLMLEKGPGVTEGLLDREQQAYGIRFQKVSGSIIQFTLNAIPDRIITITPVPANGCSVRATTMIAGEPAILKSIYVDLWLFGVKQITVYGTRIRDGVFVKEDLK